MMKVIDTAIPEVKIIEPTLYLDERGSFMETWNHKNFCGNISIREFVQDNQSFSHHGVLRGLHYQLSPHQQGKLVRVVSGSVFDVAVDIRPHSNTYGKHVSVILSAENRKMFWIPEGFAHGFLSLEDNTTFLYKTTAYYNKESERVFNWKSPDLNIDWPTLDRVIVNEKDSSAPLFEY